MFSDFKLAVERKFEEMQKQEMFRVKVDKDQLWDRYLSSFPEGTNPIFRERTEHDCQCCKSFIRAVGDVVVIKDGNLDSLWDLEVPEPYKTVASSLAQFIKRHAIDNQFLHPEPSAGVDKNYQQLESGEVLTWEHFHLKIPRANVVRKDMIGTKLSESRSTRDVMMRGLKEITVDALETVIDLIKQNSLYRGEENLASVTSFLKLKKEFDQADNQELFCWEKVKTAQSVARIRGTAIGTLLVDLSEGRELEEAVKSFEVKVAPTNYKRPTALITKAMISKAEKTVQELGFASALERRHAKVSDITINNILFADREARKSMGVFDELAAAVPESSKKLDKVEEIGIEVFIHNVLPTASSIELMLENKHTGNLFSLIAPADPNAKTMFKWHNNFSWSYAGEVADSIKERVKSAGGNVEADLRCSLSWFNFDDLDLHMIEPGGYRIYYGNRNRQSPCGGTLDVDMNAGGGETRSAVENICYPNKFRMKEGTYKLVVNNFKRRESVDVGFEVEIEFDGVVHTFHYPKLVANGTNVTVAEFKYSHKNGLEFTETLPSAAVAKEVWGLKTQNFHRVSMMMYSPNHWDERATGNKHYFFILDGCRNDTTARGFFNEFLTDDLRDHRKVFEVLGSKMKVEDSAEQLSGLGFSSTKRSSVLCKVKGNFARTVKIIF